MLMYYSVLLNSLIKQKYYINITHLILTLLSDHEDIGDQGGTQGCAGEDKAQHAPGVSPRGHQQICAGH